MKTNQTNCVINKQIPNSNITNLAKNSEEFAG